MFRNHVVVIMICPNKKTFKGITSNRPKTGTQSKTDRKQKNDPSATIVPEQ